MNSQLLSFQHLRFFKSSVQVFSCELVHSAFCMLFCVRSCQGAEEYIGTQSAGSSGHLWPRKFSVLEAIFSCIGLVIVTSFPGPFFSFRRILCAPPPAPCLPLSTEVLVVIPSGQAGVMEAPFGSTRELSISKVRQLRVGAILLGNLFQTECKIILESFDFCLSERSPRKL